MTEPDPALASELWLLTHPDLRDTVRIQAVMRVLYEELGKVAGLVGGACLRRGRNRPGPFAVGRIVIRHASAASGLAG